MPLPPNTNLSVLGYSRPGDTLQSKPKQAILVRLSSETLDALESFSTQPSQIQFEFGDNPGIHVGDAHFPMRHYKENAIHELFLRASSATKKNAPLKLHANVVGRFNVERELAGVRDKIRESTQDAANQRNSRTTVFIETPPDIPTLRKRKEAPSSSMFRKPLRPADKLTAPQLTSNASAPSKGANLSSHSHLGLVRKQVLQCLALGEKTEDQVMRGLENSDRTLPSRRELQDLLDLVAEPSIVKGNPMDKTFKLYRLKLSSWKEVRPYEWSTLSEPEQTSIARSARIAFKNLRIPESDPVWNHVRFRTPVATTSTADHAQALDQKKQDVPKRAVTSHEARERKNKPKLDTKKSEIMMKDESLRVTPRMALHDNKLETSSESRRTAETSLTETTRGQGSQVSKTAKSRVSDSYSPLTVGKAISVRQSNKDNISFASSNKPSPDDKHLPISSSQKTRKKRPEDEISIGESDREKRRSKGEKANLNNTLDGTRAQISGSSTKRKALEHSVEIFHEPVASSISKRRRTEYEASSSVPSSDRTKNAAAKEPPVRKSHLNTGPSERPSQKPLPSSSTSMRFKKDDSPPSKRNTVPNNASERTYSESSSRSRTSGSQSSKPSGSKARRPPVYTSSEEEEPPVPTLRPPGNAA
ncbi:hypothetical protein CPB84DRAFT_406382 [Gymnopilus junonius]|uniref:RNA polymerase II elongation factor ELL N-terminal domain-containing protein n=1 Tax=Gymnopilus junonius TaxID=109634 RepID=A0A9P5NWW9_GYMJU|nr:hypothetical protein CPB84DRAFT_406382 [Gymnopilus junonius]